jgi:hypothetical protein
VISKLVAVGDKGAGPAKMIRAHRTIIVYDTQSCCFSSAKESSVQVNSRPSTQEFQRKPETKLLQDLRVFWSYKTWRSYHRSPSPGLFDFGESSSSDVARVVSTTLRPPCNQNPPTLFFPDVVFFLPTGSRPPNGPGTICVLGIDVNESE